MIDEIINEWIPVTERLPDDDELYWVYDLNSVHWDCIPFNNCVIAWHPMKRPEPYKPEPKEEPKKDGWYKPDESPKKPGLNIIKLINGKYVIGYISILGNWVCDPGINLNDQIEKWKYIEE